ncbi:hypothetical protein QP727_09225, partial [Lactobacillus jensenii]
RRPRRLRTLRNTRVRAGGGTNTRTHETRDAGDGGFFIGVKLSGFFTVEVMSEHWGCSFGADGSTCRA